MTFKTKPSDIRRDELHRPVGHHELRATDMSAAEPGRTSAVATQVVRFRLVVDEIERGPQCHRQTQRIEGVPVVDSRPSGRIIFRVRSPTRNV